MEQFSLEPIRQAVNSEEFDRAGRLWEQYAGQLHQAILDGSATGAMLSETRQLVDWSALVVKAFRAHAGAQLNSLHVAEVYGGAGSRESRAIIRASF
jgi:hypothetical protein